MIINGEKLKRLAVYDTMMTVPDCFVVRKNKLGTGNGEAKLYIGSKEAMYDFYGHAGFRANCFLLKTDLVAYMNAIYNEYMNPSQDYTGKSEFPALWLDRMQKINRLDEIIRFTVVDQHQIEGPRGYVNSQDTGYQLIRTIALPLVSYIYVEKVGNEKAPLFYWKLFVDFDAIWEKQSVPLVFKYGQKPTEYIPTDIKAKNSQEEQKRESISKAREGQGKYREQLLEQCPFCPVTMISDDRLLIASHIKPWAASTDDEKTDPYNGYMLSPMIDKLFDRGFITFTNDKRMHLSDVISQRTWKQIGLKNKDYFQGLKMDEKREKYLKFHHESVFKGSLDIAD